MVLSTSARLAELLFNLLFKRSQPVSDRWRRHIFYLADLSARPAVAFKSHYFSVDLAHFQKYLLNFNRCDIIKHLKTFNAFKLIKRVGKIVFTKSVGKHILCDFKNQRLFFFDLTERRQITPQLHKGDLSQILCLVAVKSPWKIRNYAFIILFINLVKQFNVIHFFPWFCCLRLN